MPLFPLFSLAAVLTPSGGDYYLVKNVQSVKIVFPNVCKLISSYHCSTVLLPLSFGTVRIVFVQLMECIQSCGVYVSTSVIGRI